MNKLLIPDLMWNDVFTADYEILKKHNIKGILFDIDNTLAPFNTDVPTKEACALFKKLRYMGFLIGVLSNAAKERSRKYAESANVFYAGRADKPSVKGFVRTAEMMHLEAKEIAMIGDQIFTDIKGGNKFGALTVLVKPVNLKTEPWYTKIKRGPEKIVLERLKKYGKN